MTAKEFLRNKKNVIGLRSQASPLGSEGTEIEVMIEFAQYHVTEALKAASEKAEIELDDLGILGTHYVVNKESILTAYPLENIK